MLSQGNEATYAEEESEDHVVDENRLDEYVNIVHVPNALMCKCVNALVGHCLYFSMMSLIVICSI